jgi:hypothetical protein
MKVFNAATDAGGDSKGSQYGHPSGGSPGHYGIRGEQK